MDQTVGIRLNMLASSQAPSLSKSIKHNFITTLQLLVGEEVRVVGLTERRGGEKENLHEKRERGSGWRELPAAKCWCTLRSAESSFSCS